MDIEKLKRVLYDLKTVGLCRRNLETRVFKIASAESKLAPRSNRPLSLKPMLRRATDKNPDLILFSLSETHPDLVAMKVRKELEVTLKDLARANGVQFGKGTSVSLEIVPMLVSKRILSTKQSSTICQLYSLLSGAAHEDSVCKEAAQLLLQTYNELLQALRELHPAAQLV